MQLPSQGRTEDGFFFRAESKYIKKAPASGDVPDGLMTCRRFAKGGHDFSKPGMVPGQCRPPIHLPEPDSNRGRHRGALFDTKNGVSLSAGDLTKVTFVVNGDADRREALLRKADAVEDRLESWLAAEQGGAAIAEGNEHSSESLADRLDLYDVVGVRNHLVKPPLIHHSGGSGLGGRTAEPGMGLTGPPVMMSAMLERAVAEFTVPGAE
jgi:hypothetical protein